MRISWSQLACIVAAALTAAKDDADYDPSENFRPRNITGLASPYRWIGSYYNGTTKVQLSPETGHYRDDELCEPLRNKTGTMTWNSILTVADRGSYNRGPDLINMWLLLIPDGYNLSSTPWDLRDAHFWWPVRSTILVHREHTEPTDDLFNFTVSKSDDAFTFTGVMEDLDGKSSSEGSGYRMDTCNSSYYNGNWRVTIWQSAKGTYPLTQPWKDYAPPSVNGSFDAKTAKVVIEGKYNGAPFLRRNDSVYTGGMSGELGQSVEGSITFEFDGEIDAYHSDILNLNDSVPSWLRTVGFGNNTDNIANESSASSVCLSLSLVAFSGAFAMLFP